MQLLKAAAAKERESEGKKKPDFEEPELLNPLPGPSEIEEQHPLAEDISPSDLREKVQDPEVRGENKCTRCSQNSRKLENTRRKNRRLLKNISNLKHQNVCLFYHT